MGLYDVVIVGAGISGLSLSRELDGHLKVLLLDKKRTPYSRIACAEWVPQNFPFKGINRIEGLVIEYENLKVEKRWRGKIVDRGSIQKGMLLSLKKVDVHLGEKVLRVDERYIYTDRGRYEYGILVGADGPYSIVRRSFGRFKGWFIGAVNLRYEISSYYDKAYIFFFKEIERGYGWFFPKGKQANIGVGAVDRLGESLKFFINFIKGRFHLRDRVEYAAGLIPVVDILPSINKRVFLIGDAGGFIDPLTGAGIYQAWDSARMLALLIKGQLTFEEYMGWLKRSYIRFIKRRHKLRRIFDERWGDIKRAVEETWISTFQG